MTTTSTSHTTYTDRCMMLMSFMLLLFATTMQAKTIGRQNNSKSELTLELMVKQMFYLMMEIVSYDTVFYKPDLFYG